MAFRDLRNSNTFYQPVGLKRAGALQDVEKPAWQRVDATSHSDKDKENAPPNLAATTTSISPWKQTKKEVDNNELQQQDVELTHAIQGQKYLCGDVSQDHHVKNIRETISLTSQPLNVVRLNNGAYTSPIHVQSFPLVDPFRGLSKAKDPVIAPPKSSNPPLTHGRSTKEDPDCLGWSFDESLLSLEFLNIHDFAEQSVQRPHTINTSPTTNTNNTSNIPKAWNTLLTRQGTGCPFAPLPCEKYEMTRLKDGFPTLRNNDTSNFKKLGNSHELGRQLRQLTNRKDINAAHDAEKLIRTAIQRYRRGESQLRPDGACFNYVIHAYAELGDAEAAESLLVVMFEEFGSGNLDAEPNVRVFTNVLHAWRKTKSKEAPERCERILEHMHRLHESAELPDCKPDTFSYTVLFHCWAESGRSDAAERADRLFRNMKDKVSKGQHQLRPDAIAYSNMVNIFVQHPSTHFRAEDVLWEMVEDYLGGNDTAKPRIRNFNTILAMWSKSVADEAPDRAQSIVSKLMRLNSNHKLDCTPDAYTYSLLLKTWAGAKRRDGASKALECLEWMRKLFSEGDEAARPDTIKYTTCISALAKAGQPASAEFLLDTMRADFLHGNHKALPECRTFDIVINAWTGGFNDQAPLNTSRAEELLQQMWKLNATDRFRHIRPTGSMYRRIITALKNARKPDRAESLLLDMDSLFAARKLDEGPNEEIVNIVIEAWQSSACVERDIHVQQLKTMIQQRFHSRSSKSLFRSE